MEIVSERLLDDSRFYMDEDGIEYLSVTSLLSKYSNKDILIKWRQRIGDEAADEIVNTAVTNGKNAHAQLEAYFADTTYKVDDIFASKAITDFYSRVDLVSCEEVVSYVDPTTNAAYAGRYDSLVWVPEEAFRYQDMPEHHIKSGLYLTDLKTKRKLPNLNSYKFYVKHLLQGSAYFNALRHLDIIGFIIVCVGKRKSRLFMLDLELLEYYWGLYETMLIDYYGERKYINSFWDDFVDKPIQHITELQQFVSYQPHIII